MDRHTSLIALTATNAALCWWPVVIQPNLDLPFWWFPLVLIALGTMLSAILADEHWLHYTFVSVGGSCAGICSGFLIWRPADRIDASFVPVVVISATLATIPVALVAGLVGRRFPAVGGKRRGVVWLALICCGAFAPLILSLTPQLVAIRVARDDRISGKRFESLAYAVERTMAETRAPERICDGSALKGHYSGPPFSDSDWRYITGNYVKQNGYLFMIYCQQKGGYTIDARPARQKGDGSHHFCTDESGVVACGMEWNRSRYACTPCAK